MKIGPTDLSGIRPNHALSVLAWLLVFGLGLGISNPSIGNAGEDVPLPLVPAVPPPSTGELLFSESSAPFASSEAWEHAKPEEPGTLETGFEDGFFVRTRDDKFELRIRLMEQTDFKLFSPHQEPARSGVYIPRFRSYFEGHVTKSFEYELSLQRSVEGTFDVLDANINFSPNEAFQIKVGRFLVPYSYDWYDHLEQYFITPERGLFPLNFGLSREAGAMVWGTVADERLQYAIGGFSGQLAGLADNNTARDAVGYVNLKPWIQRDDRPMLKHLNLGGSVAMGDQVVAGEPLPLRTSLQASENDEAAQAASAVFLEFDDDVVLLGGRDQAALHLAWYYKGLSLETEGQVGRFRFQNPTSQVSLPVRGYHVTTSYFVTGEEITGRSVVKPLKPFDPAGGQWGTGAVEPYARWSHLSLGKEIFEADLADEHDWTRRVSLLDLGWNWYPNEFVKFYFDWQTSFYDTPILIKPEEGKRAKRSTLFWLRAQISF